MIQPFWTQNDLEYYYDDLALETIGLPGSDFVTWADRAQLREIATGRDRIWLLRYQTNRTDRVLATLSRSHRLTFSHRDGLLALYRFERGGTSSVRLDPPPLNGRSVVTTCDLRILRGCVPTPINRPKHVVDERPGTVVNPSENLRGPT